MLRWAERGSTRISLSFLPIRSICKCCIKCFCHTAIRLSSICSSERAVLGLVNLLGLNQFPKPEIIHHPLQPRETLIRRRESSLLAHQSLEFSQSISLEFSESITLERLNSFDTGTEGKLSMYKLDKSTNSTGRSVVDSFCAFVSDHMQEV